MDVISLLSWVLTITPLPFRIALRLACDKLPTSMEFIDNKAPPRLGNLLIIPESAAESNSLHSAEPITA